MTISKMMSRLEAFDVPQEILSRYGTAVLRVLLFT